MQEINLEIVEKDGLVKVTSPYNQKFVNKARNLRGQWKENAWWFDDSIIDYVRDLMIECFGTTGEEPYENVDLVISNFSESKFGGAVELLRLKQLSGLQELFRGKEFSKAERNEST